MGKIASVILTPLKTITADDGNIYHIMKKDDDGYIGFGEAYLTTIKQGKIKAWKRHQKMTDNLVVTTGRVRFVIFDDCEHSPTNGFFQEVLLSAEDRIRLTIPPLLWFGFQGVGDGVSTILNIASIPHEPSEVDRKEFNKIEYNWNVD